MKNSPNKDVVRSVHILLALPLSSSVDIRERSRSPRCPDPARLHNVLFLLLYVYGLHDHDNSCMRKTVIEHRLSCVELV